MNDADALKLAISILQSFGESGPIYDDYKSVDGFTDEQYDDMLTRLEILRKRIAGLT